MTFDDCWGGEQVMRPVRALGVAALLFVLPLRAAGAQGTWEVGAGAFKNAVDTQSTSGVALEFSRWPGGEKKFQHGFHIAYFWGRQDVLTVTLPSGSAYSHTIESWSSWGLGFGKPFRVGPANWPVRPFLEAEPGGMLYRSHHATKYYPNGISDRVGLIDKSKWLIGPSLGLGTGVQIPGKYHGPRLQVRADYRVAWLLGGEGEAIGVKPNGVWSSFGVKAGAMFAY
jgi:hypothetical protein